MRHAPLIVSKVLMAVCKNFSYLCKDVRFRLSFNDIFKAN